MKPISIIRYSFIFCLLSSGITGSVSAQAKDEKYNVSIFMQDFHQRISGLAFDSSGFMYTSINGNLKKKRILKISHSSGKDTIASIECFAVQYLSTGWDNSLYASVVIERGKNNACILRIAPDKNVSVISDGFIQPVGITFDSHHNMYVVDAMSEKVYKITPENAKSVIIDLGVEGSINDILYHGIAYNSATRSLYLAGINMKGGTGNLIKYNLTADDRLAGGPSIISKYNCKHIAINDNKIFVSVNIRSLLVKDLITDSEYLIDDPLLTDAMSLSFGNSGFDENSLFVNTSDKIIKVSFLNSH